MLLCLLLLVIVNSRTINYIELYTKSPGKSAIVEHYQNINADRIFADCNDSSIVDRGLKMIMDYCGHTSYRVNTSNVFRGYRTEGSDITIDFLQDRLTIKSQSSSVILDTWFSVETTEPGCVWNQSFDQPNPLIWMIRNIFPRRHPVTSVIYRELVIRDTIHHNQDERYYILTENPTSNGFNGFSVVFDDQGQVGWIDRQTTIQFGTNYGRTVKIEF